MTGFDWNSLTISFVGGMLEFVEKMFIGYFMCCSDATPAIDKFHSQRLSIKPGQKLRAFCIPKIVRYVREKMEMELCEKPSFNNDFVIKYNTAQHFIK